MKFFRLVDMNNMLIITIVITCLLFSGCAGDEGPSETSLSSEANSSSAQNPDLIIKPGDVPEFTLDEYSFYAVPKNYSYELPDFNLENSSYVEQYTDSLPLGTRNVGEMSRWVNEFGYEVTVSITKFDSDLGFESLDADKNALKNISERREDTEYGTGSIGIDCYYYTITSGSLDEDYKSYMDYALVCFRTSNHEIVGVIVDYDVIGVADKEEKGESLNKAIRIAKIIEARMD